MTEQELLEAISGHVSFGNMQPVMDAAKAYADARVADECKVLDETVTLLHQTIANRNVEIAQLKASLGQAQQMYADLLVGTTDAINAKDAELKRLREFAQQCQKSPEKLVKMNWFEDGGFDYCDLVPLQEAAASVLSPAPVTEGQKCTCSYSFQGDLVRQCKSCKEGRFIPAPVTETTTAFRLRNLPQDTTNVSPINEDQE